MGWACLENERLFLGVENQLLAGFRLDAGREEREQQGHEAIARPTHEVGGPIAVILYDSWPAQLIMAANREVWAHKSSDFVLFACG